MYHNLGVLVKLSMSQLSLAMYLLRGDIGLYEMKMDID